jgi:osmoprotectant transport system ATP-binding protein
VISIDSVAKTYDGRRALGPVSLDVAEGARVAVVGPSGCGKSTLLRVVLGLVVPDAGRVMVGGELVDARTRVALRRRIGYVVQDGGLFPHLTAEGNVALVARHLGWDEARIAHRVDELAQMTGIDRAVLERWPVQLSGGQRQRVGVMRALFLDPDVVLMDEPLGALDPITRRRLQGELRALFRSLGKTLMLVTHDVAEAAFLADEAVVMRDGQIVQRGAVDAMTRAPRDAFVRELLAPGPVQV